MKPIIVLLAAATLSFSVLAKLPALSDEAKAKAAEAAAKTAHTGKVDNFLLCKSIDKAAAHYYKTAKAEKKDTKPPVATAPCADPGPFVYVVASAAPAAGAPAAPAAQVAAAPTKPADKPADKKK
jgi:hypothetical protein